MPRYAVAIWIVLLGLVQGVAWGGGPVTSEDVGSVMARTALIDLGMRDTLLPEDYAVAAAALWTASGLRPRDAEIARLTAAAAWSSGDRELLLDATRVVIRNDPDDTVAQLRLISANINGRQTVEDRLDAFERFLGGQGRSLNRSVRSRLALDAALLMRETGDREGFEKRLREAVDLDPTNKDAVSLAARTFSHDDAPVNELAAWQVRLLYADPLDPHVHLTIGRICATQGAIEQGERFMTNAARLFRIEMGDVPGTLRDQLYALQWQRQGAESVIASLNLPLRDMRQQAGDLIQARQEAGEPITDLRRPEEIRFDPNIERVRLLAAYVIDDEETIKASLNDMAVTTSESLSMLAENLPKVSGADQGRLLLEMIRVYAEFQTMRAIVQREYELIGEQTQQFFGQIPGVSELLKPLEAWVAYAEGDYTRALDLIGRPRAGTNDDFLVALASERLEDYDTAAPIYVRYARARALDAYGAFARERLRAIGRERDILSTAGRQLDSAMSRVPGWMDRMINDPRTFMLLQAESSASTMGPLERSRLMITLRNTSPIPLGLGSSRPIGSRMLIAPRPISRIADFAGSPSPRVLEMDRRLRLEPLEEIRVATDADSAYTEWLREINASISLRDRYRVIQSFQPARRGGLINSPLALVTESPIVQRVTLGLAREPVDVILDAIRSDNPAQIPAAVVATMARTIDPLDDLELSSSDRRRLADAWAERFGSANDAERAFMLFRLPHAGQVPEFEVFDRVSVETFVAESVEREHVDTPVLLAAMMTRVREVDSPVFDLAELTRDRRVHRMAELVRERLRAGRPSFATAGPGAGGLAPPTDAARTSLTP
ncbi:MAG: hypothetical protein LAT64_09770 [Phycisphaerales bacterium]|nr:hypothetical protein [Planctomycetota bacterium]MCH8509036.1 hypothetical protein [Phycisphaerales bacterium]